MQIRSGNPTLLIDNCRKDALVDIKRNTRYVELYIL